VGCRGATAAFWRSTRQKCAGRPHRMKRFQSTPAIPVRHWAIRSSDRRQHLAKHPSIDDPAHSHQAIRLINLDDAVHRHRLKPHSGEPRPLRTDSSLSGTGAVPGMTIARCAWRRISLSGAEAYCGERLRVSMLLCSAQNDSFDIRSTRIPAKDAAGSEVDLSPGRGPHPLCESANILTERSGSASE
jgi:hypothetical protein